MEKKLYYFGCIETVGHYLYDSNRRQLSNSAYKFIDSGVSSDLFNYLDGMFTPPKYKPGYVRNQIGNMVIISWWDTTVDKRPGSNSNIIAIGYTGYTTDQIFAEFTDRFPLVMQRQKKPLPHNESTSMDQHNQTDLWYQAAVLLFQKHNGRSVKDEMDSKILHGFLKDMEELGNHFLITKR